MGESDEDGNSPIVFEREIIVYPASREEAPYVVTTTRFLSAAKDIVRDPSDGDGPVELDMIELSEAAYTGERDPWTYPQFEDGCGGDESPTAYGRRERARWLDSHYVVVHGRGRLHGMAANEYFASLPTRRGHQLLGPVVVHRFLHEGGCGDNVSLPVDACVLAERALPDPRRRGPGSSSPG